MNQLGLSDFDILINNTGFLQRVNKLSKQAAKITKQISMLMQLRHILPNEAFEQERSEIQCVISASQLIAGASIENNFEQINGFKKQFAAVKQRIGIRAEDIKRAIQAECTQETRTNISVKLLEEKLVRWGTRTVLTAADVRSDDSLSDAAPAPASRSYKRKRVKEDDEESEGDLGKEISEPVLKKGAVESTEKEKEKEAGQEKTQGLAPFQKNSLQVKAIEPAVANLDRLAVKMIPGHEELIMLSEKNPNSFFRFDSKTRKIDAHTSNSEKILDITANPKFLALIVGQKIHIYGKSSTESLYVNDRPVLGSLDHFYDDRFMDAPTKIQLVGDNLAIGFWSGEVLLVNLLAWQQIEKEVAEAIKKGWDNEQINAFKKEQFKKATYNFNAGFFDVAKAVDIPRGNPAGNMPIYSLTMDSQYLVVGSSARFTGVYNLKDGTARLFKGQPTTVTAVALSKDGSCMYSGSKNGNINIWDLANNKLIHIQPLPGEEITQIETEQAGAFIVTASKNGNKLYHFDENTKDCTLLYNSVKAVCVVDSADACALYMMSIAGNELHAVQYPREKP